MATDQRTHKVGTVQQDDSGMRKAAEGAPLGMKVVRNVGFSVLRVGLVLPIQFLLIPYILKNVGVGGYGTWAVLLVVISLTSLVDLGLSGTLTKHAAEYYTHGDFKALNRLIDTGQVLYALISMVAVLLLNLASPLLIGVLFRGSPTSPHELTVLWTWSSLLVACNFLGFPFYSVLLGLQRMDLSNIVSYSKVALGALFTVFFLYTGRGLRGLVYANLLAVVLTLLMSAGMVRALLPQLRSYGFAFDRGELKRIFGFGVKIYVTQVAVAMDSQISKMYLGALAGVQSAGCYNIANETAWKIRGVPELLLGPVMAAASELDARGDHARLRELYFRSHKYIALCGVPLVLGVAFFCKRLVHLWLGANLAAVALPLSVLVILYFFNLTSGPGYLIFIGRGLLGPGMKSALVSLTLNLSLGLVLVYFYGLWGGVLTTCVSVISGTAYFLYLFGKESGISFWSVIRQAYLKPAVCALCILAIFYRFVAVDGLGWGGLAVLGVVFGVFYILGLALSRFFDSFDRQIARNLLPMAGLARRMPVG